MHGQRDIGHVRTYTTPTVNLTPYKKQTKKLKMAGYNLHMSTPVVTSSHVIFGYLCCEPRPTQQNSYYISRPLDTVTTR